jgi:hypothetical protein
MIINFVEKTFIPILNNKIPETVKVLEQWNQFKNFIHDSENVDMKKTEKFINELQQNINTHKINTEQCDKPTHNLQAPILHETEPKKHRRT